MPIFMGSFFQLQGTFQKFPNVREELLFRCHFSGRTHGHRYQGRKSRLTILYFLTILKLKIHSLYKIVSSNQPS